MARGKMLVVDDVEINRAILKHTYGEEYDVLEAVNGKDCLDTIYRYHKDIKAVFLDIIMPQMDGFGVLQELEDKGLLGEFPVFLVTTETSDYVVNRAYKYGVVDIIPKPFDILIIKRRVNNIVALYEARRKQLKEVGKKTLLLEQQKVIYNTILEMLASSMKDRAVSESYSIRRIVCAANILFTYIAHNYPEFGIKERRIALMSEVMGLYDIGKIGIPDRILFKAGPLTAEETAIMQTHCEIGERMLETLKEFEGTMLISYARTMAKSHHERYDGKGYPEGLSGEAIPIEAGVAGILDAYDALLSERSYRKAYSHEEAKAMILEGKCGAFSPILLECFRQTIDSIYGAIYAVKG